MKIVPSLTAFCLAGLSVLAAASPRLQQNFDFDWHFHLGDVPQAADAKFDDTAWRLLDVPHDFSIEGEFNSNNVSSTAYLPGGIAWYRKTFKVPADWKDKLVAVEFEGVSMKSEVWLNGHSLGQRPYAYSTFQYDLTPYLNRDGDNVLAVRVDRSVIDDSRWYTGSGIYRHVWLIANNPVHVARHGVTITTPEAAKDKASVQIDTRVQNQTSSAQTVGLVTEILGPDGKSVQRLTGTGQVPAHGESTIHQTAAVSRPQLWSPDSPSLYHAVSRVQTGGQIQAQLETTFGIRSVQFDGKQGFLLNGQPTKFNGVCLHHDAGALGAAVPDRTWELRLRALKEMGGNAVRTSHNPESPVFYDWCDRLGILVMDEFADEWTGAKRKWVTGWNQGQASLHPGYSEFFDQWCETDLREMVERDRNHPSVILWSIGNEIDYPGDPYSHPADGKDYDPKKPNAEILAQTAPRLIKVVRACDPSRPITAGLANMPASNATGLADLLDVVGYNYQPDVMQKDFAKYPNRKFIFSEDDYGQNYLDLMKDPRVTGMFVWVGFDYLGETRGWPAHGWDEGWIDSTARIKPSGWQRAAVWVNRPYVYIAVPASTNAQAARSWQGQFGSALMRSDWNWAGDARAELPVEIYSNCEWVELFLNGRSLGRKTWSDEHNGVRAWPVPYAPGELKAVGARNGHKVEYTLTTAGAAARLQVAPDVKTLTADGEDTANVEVRMVDSRGNVVPGANQKCTLTVTGAGRLRALDNGDLHDNTLSTSPTKALSLGRALATVQSGRTPGTIKVVASAPGVPDASVELSVK